MAKAKINHDAENLQQATGVDINALQGRLREAFNATMESSEYFPHTQLIEMFESNFTKRELGIIATNYIVKLIEMENPMAKFMAMMSQDSE